MLVPAPSLSEGLMGGSGLCTLVRLIGSNGTGFCRCCYGNSSRENSEGHHRFSEAPDCTKILVVHRWILGTGGSQLSSDPQRMGCAVGMRLRQVTPFSLCPAHWPDLAVIPIPSRGSLSRLPGRSMEWI